MANQVIPEKLSNLGSIRNAADVKVLLNAFRLDLNNAVDSVHKYELKFVLTKDTGKERDLSTGAKNDVAKQNRMRLLWELYSEMLTNNPHFFGSQDQHRSFVYDCGINLYSIKELNIQEGQSTHFTLSASSISEESRAYLGGHIKQIVGHILRGKDSKINLKSLDAVLSDGGDRSAVQFLEILSNQEVIRMNGYSIFAQKMFEKMSQISLQNDPRILKEGMQKNVRFVGDSVDGAIPVVQIGPKKAAFFPEMMLDQFIFSLLPGQENLLQKLSNTGNFKFACDQIKGLVVITTHLPNKQRSFELDGLSESAAMNTFFEHNGQEISVPKYFEQLYALRLKSPQLPCAKEKQFKSQSFNFYPLEVLKIRSDQRIPLNKQNPQLTEQLIRNCQALPSKYDGLIQKQKMNAAIVDNNPFFKEHGLRVDPKLMDINASVLFAPAIVYGTDRQEPEANGHVSWRMPQSRKYLIPAAAPQVWVAVNLQMGVGGDECRMFVDKIVSCANNRGILIQRPNRCEVFESVDADFIRQRFEFFKSNGCQYVLFFSRGKTDPAHHIFKLMEVEFGIITQDVAPQAVIQAIGPKGFTLIDNFLFKMNLKLGGVNHGLSTPRINPQFTHDVVAKEWVSDSRCFMGIDVSHAPPQSLYDRQSKKPCTDPTVVGMSFTVGHPVKMLGNYWMQETRVACVQSLQQYVVKSMQSFRSSTGKFPLHLIVYRGGVSEGEYQIILDKEKEAFVDAFAELEKKEKDFRVPALTIVVVQRASNYRVVPVRINERAKPAEQNVNMGTCVDRGAMHPSFTEFLLVPHRAIQGTANPIRCTVICDFGSGRMSLEEVENVTNTLCYAHAIVTSPVSVPAPLYAAAELAKRGKNNLKVSGDRGYGAVDADSGGGGSFFEDLSRRLQPGIRTKFWA